MIIFCNKSSIFGSAEPGCKAQLILHVIKAKHIVLPIQKNNVKLLNKLILCSEMNILFLYHLIIYHLICIIFNLNKNKTFLF